MLFNVGWAAHSENEPRIFFANVLSWQTTHRQAFISLRSVEQRFRNQQNCMCSLLMIFIVWSSMIIIMVAHVAIHGDIRDRVRNSNYTRWIRAIYQVWHGATLWCIYHCWNSKIINSHGGPLYITIHLCAYFELREYFVPDGPLEFILFGFWALCGISR